MRAPAAACVRHARLSLLLPRAWHSFVACPLAPTVPRSRGGAASALPPCCRTAFPHPPSPCPPPPPPHPHPHSADPDQNIMRILVPLSNLASWVRGGREQGGRGRHKGGGGGRAAWSLGHAQVCGPPTFTPPPSRPARQGIVAFATLLSLSAVGADIKPLLAVGSVSTGRCVCVCWGVARGSWTAACLPCAPLPAPSPSLPPSPTHTSTP